MAHMETSSFSEFQWEREPYYIGERTEGGAHQRKAYQY